MQNIIERNIELNEQVTAAIDATNDIVVAYHAAKELIAPLFAEKDEADEIWTDCAEDAFCLSPYDRLVSSAAEYALVRASIVAECDEFEMNADEETAKKIALLIAEARKDQITEAQVLDLLPFLTRNNDDLEQKVEFFMLQK